MLGLFFIICYNTKKIIFTLTKHSGLRWSSLEHKFVHETICLFVDESQKTTFLILPLKELIIISFTYVLMNGFVRSPKQAKKCLMQFDLLRKIQNCWKISKNSHTGGPRNMGSFYLQFRVYAIENRPFLRNISSNL